MEKSEAGFLYAEMRLMKENKCMRIDMQQHEKAFSEKRGADRPGGTNF